jgi:hypothetical protein
MASLKVPENTNEICLEQYQRFLKIHDKVGDCEFLKQKAVEIFCNIKLQHVLLIKQYSVEAIYTSLTNLFQEQQPLTRTFKIGKQEFGFIPDIEEMSYGEFVDLDTNISDWENMHKAMAVLFRPIEKSKDDKYRIIPYHGTHEFSDLMKFMPLDIALGAIFFFVLLGNELLKAMPHFLEGELMKMNSAKKGNSKEVGDGITRSIHSLRETLEDLMKSQPFPLSNALQY